MEVKNPMKNHIMFTEQVETLLLLDGAWTNLRAKMRPYNHDYGRYGAPLISEGPHDLQTSRGRSAFFQDLGVAAFSLWVILLAPLSDCSTLICYCVLLCIGILTALFAGIMALKEYFAVH